MAQYQAADDGVLIAQTGFNQVYQFDEGNLANGVPVSSLIRKDYMDFGMPESYKTVTRIWPRVTTQENVRIFCRIGTSDSPTLPVTWAPGGVNFFPQRTGSTDQYVDIIATGRYLSFQFQTSGSGSLPFQFEGFDVEVSAPRGRY